MKVTIIICVMLCIVLTFNVELLNAQRKPERCAQACPLIFAPYCAYDRFGQCLQEFSNSCFMGVANCKQKNSKY